MTDPAMTPGAVPAMSTSASRPPVCPCRQYRYSAPGVATTLYSRLVGVTAGLGVPSTTTGYIQRRLQLAGANSNSSVLFPADTIVRVHRHSRGIPRLINTVCENALITAYARQARSVTPDIIEDIAADFRLGVVHQPKADAPAVTRKATRGEQRKLCSSCMTICRNCNRARENHGQPQQPEPLNMSRIFEALQRSESERSGTPLAPPALATELLQAVEREASATAPKDFPAIELADKISLRRNSLKTNSQRQLENNDLSRFQSLPVSLPQDSKLVCLTAPESFGAEKFRFLGVRLRQLQHSRPLKKLLITSTIPEEGKSTVSANLATILARKQQPKILLLDGDLRRPSLSKQFGLGKLPGLSEWLHGEPRPIEHIYRLEGPNLWFLPAGRPPENPLELMQSGRLSRLMESTLSLV